MNNDDVLKALDYALKEEVPFKPGKTLFVNPTGVIDMPGEVHALQSFKPHYDLIEKHQDWTLEKDWEDLDGPYDHALIILPKQKDQARGWLARAFQVLKDDGIIVCVLANKAGGPSLAKQHKDAESISKHKSRVVWAQKDGFINEDLCEEWIQQSHAKKIEGDTLVASPGVFSWRKIDLGSKLLIEYLPDHLAGKGADFGCGYGFLSHHLLSAGIVSQITCIDADNLALKDAVENLSDYKGVTFDWFDLTRDKPSDAPFDWIVMNPPFHEDTKESSDIGKAFIENAVSCLNKEGVLYMVANTHLPYEKTLINTFAEVEKLCEEDGFKVFKATA